MRRSARTKRQALLDQLNAKREETLPLVLTPAEVQGIIQHADSLCHKTYLQLVYTCGLRLSEGRNVKVDHIDGQVGRLLVKHGKGAKDRYVPLTLTTYRLMRAYWKCHRNPVWLNEVLTKDRNQPRHLPHSFCELCNAGRSPLPCRRKKKTRLTPRSAHSHRSNKPHIADWRTLSASSLLVRPAVNRLCQLDGQPIPLTTAYGSTPRLIEPLD